MSQITIYLENEIEQKVRAAAKASQLSVSKFITNVLKEKTATEWPQDVIKLAGCWKDDFPSLQEIRSNRSDDAPREIL